MSSTLDSPASEKLRESGRRRRFRLLRAAGGRETDRGPRSATQPLSLRRNFSWILAGNVVHALSRWAMIVVLARLGGAAMVGQLVLAFAICAPVSGLTDLGLRAALITDARRQFRFSDYLGLRLLSVALALAVVAVIVLVAGYAPMLAGIVLLVAAGKAFESLSDVFHGLLQQHERMDRIGAALMIRGPATLALLAAGVVLAGDLIWGVAAFPLALGVMFFVYDLPGGRRLLRAGSDVAFDGSKASTDETLRPRFEARTLARLAWLSLPLGIVVTTTLLMTNIPRYFISHYLGDRALGVFASIAYLGTVGTLVIGAIGQSVTPRLARLYADGRRGPFVSLLAKLLGLVGVTGVLLVLLMAVAGGPILGLVYGGEFAGHVELAVCLMLAAAVTYLSLPMGRAVQAMRRFRLHMAIRGASVLLLLALVPWMTIYGGLLGAAHAALIAATFASVAYGYFLCRALRSETGFAPQGSEFAPQG